VWLIRYKMSARSAHSLLGMAHMSSPRGQNNTSCHSRLISSPQQMTRESPEGESARFVRPSETQRWPLLPLSINL